MPPAANSPQAGRVAPDQFDPDPRLQALLDRLTSYYPRAVDPGLERTLRLLDDLGNPHLKMPPVFHVGGTNGKGSTLAYIRAMLEAGGYRCHVMTSPHLVRFNERLVVSGTEMTTPDILALFDEVEEINRGKATTSFELITAAGFLEFARRPADFTLVEVGMGGRFDATNVIPDPLVSVITSIARDHMAFLGTRYDQIAFEKAGIIKTGVPCVVAPQSREAQAGGVMDVFGQVSEERDAPLYRAGFEWSFDHLQGGFMLHDGASVADFPAPNLVGPHQFGNAATAVMALTVAQSRFLKPLTSSQMAYGLTHARWPARLQRIVSGPFVELLPNGWELWIDGGHNDGGGMALAEQSALWKEQDHKPLHVIMGMITTKDPRDFVCYLAPYMASCATIPIPDQPLTFSADGLGTAISDTVSCPLSSATSLGEAVRHAVAAGCAYSSGRILITGSLYLMGAILKDHS